MSDVGDPRIPSLGIDLDIRTDLPRYRVWHDGDGKSGGRADRHHGRIGAMIWWRSCSAARFSFEGSADGGGRPADPPHRGAKGARADVPATNIACQPSGAVRGTKWWLSMRPFHAQGRNPRGWQITLAVFPPCMARRFHLGHPHSIGIEDVAKPDLRPMRCRFERPMEIPVCSGRAGVTPQAVIAAAKLPFAITHASRVDAGDGTSVTKIWLCFNGQPVAVL